MTHIGKFLRSQREARGLSLKDVSRVTRIKEQSLEHLETGAFDELPAPVFVRGFVLAYAREVGVKESEAIRWLAQHQRRLAETAAPPTAPVEERSQPRVDPERSLDGRRVGVVMVVLLILVVATLTLSILLQQSLGGGASQGIS